MNINKQVFYVLLLAMIPCFSVVAQKPLKKPVKRQTNSNAVTSSNRPHRTTSLVSQLEQAEIQPAVTRSNGKINGRDYVDLGLSVKWATCNVGAYSPFDHGNYYAWGETSTKTEYTQNNCKMRNQKVQDISGDSRYDVARLNWGGIWRLPTGIELKELVDKCQWEWVAQNNYEGYKIIGPNGNSIFLPAAGYYYESLTERFIGGRYWSSTSGADLKNTHYLYFTQYNQGMDWHGDRYFGRSVRPVSY